MSLDFPVAKCSFYPEFPSSLDRAIMRTDEEIQSVKEDLDWCAVLNSLPSESIPCEPLNIRLLNLYRKKVELCSQAIQYKKVKKIGKGSFGEVYQMSHATNFAQFALKIPKLNSDSSTEQRSIENEIEKLHFLNERQGSFKYVPHLNAHFELRDGRPAFLMSLYSIDLFDWLDKNKVSEQDALRFTRNILEILCFLKENGVIHLDIKPENFFVANQKRLVLGDFGSAVFKEKNLPYKGSFGTFSYMSPELLVSPKFCDFSSDMWSAASTVCVVYLNNTEMFKGKTSNQVAKRQQIRFRKIYPEYLQEEAVQLNRSSLICQRSNLKSSETFKELMNGAFLKKKGSDRKGFQQLEGILAVMFEFDHRKRISPGDALQLLNPPESASGRKRNRFEIESTNEDVNSSSV